MNCLNVQNNDLITHDGALRPKRLGTSRRVSMQVLCASSMALTPSAMRQSIAKNAHKVEEIKGIRVLEKLPQSVLSDLSVVGQEEEFAEGEVVQAARRPSPGLSILLEGAVSGVKAPAILGLQELLLGQKFSQDLKAEPKARVWTIQHSDFNRLVQDHPDLGLLLFQEMSQGLGSALEGDQQMRQALQPYLVAGPRRGVVGTSRYAQRLRHQIVEASKNRDPLLFFGEPGTEKVNHASLVHFGSGLRGKPLALVDCSRLDQHAAQVFGYGSKKGLLEIMTEGSLILTNVHRAREEVIALLADLLKTKTFAPTRDAGNTERVPVRVRVMLTAEKRVPQLDSLATIIKIAPLRVRPADIIDLQRYFARTISRRRDQAPLGLTKEAIKHLQSYSFPNNTQELESMMERAAAQAVVSAQEVPEDVFWFATQSRDRFRWNLLTAFPRLKQVLRSRLWPELINFRLTAYIYPVYVALLLFGPQDRAHNFGLNLFWDYWWPGIFLVYPFLGRVWCSVCPFMIFGELTQRWQLSRGVVLRKWPHAQVDAWGGWFLFALFAAILVWEEVWDLPNSAALSGWLLIIITAGAVVCSAIFERRLWCRHLCPIGGMNGLFAKGSITEVRAQQGICSGNCTTYHCYKGGPEEPPEGLATGGCPLASHPAQLVDNAACVLCMDCLKACPHGSVGFRLRPPLADLWIGHKASAAELSLLFMLLGAVYLHNLPQICAQFGVDVDTLEPRLPHILASTALLSAPGFLAAILDRAAAFFEPKIDSRTLTTRKPFLETGYSYLPLAWGATLSFYLRPFLGEAGTVLKVAGATVGFEDRVGVIPVWVMDGSVIAFLQGATLLVGLGGSLVLLRKLKSRPWTQILPQAAVMLAFTAELWYLIV